MSFSIKQLEELGYSLQPDGSFSRPDTSARPARVATADKAVDTGETAIVERGNEHAPFRKDKTKEGDRRRFLVRVVSVRNRLLDEDNLCEKFHVDVLRYAGIIAGDEAGRCTIQTSQRKAQKGESEHTEIEVFTKEE